MDDEFHQHLDECSQCASNPFWLCEEGARKLKKVCEMELQEQSGVHLIVEMQNTQQEQDE